jgi:hypothetical protein
MANIKIRNIIVKWKNLGFIPNGWDDSRMIKYRDQGFLYLCREYRDDWRKIAGFSVKILKPAHRKGQGYTSCSNDWTGLDEELFKQGADRSPPPVNIHLRPRQLSKEEREEAGQTAHRNWVAVRSQQRAAGQVVADDELRSWDDLPEADRELFRKSGESFALPEHMMWDAVNQMRQKMGEKAFRKKMFEISVSVAMEKMNRDWTEAERYRATDIIVKLSGMLDVSESVAPSV